MVYNMKSIILMLVKVILSAALAIAVPAAVGAAFFDDFSEGIDAYTHADLLGGGENQVGEWEVVDGALRRNQTAHTGGSNQMAFTHNKARIEVGFEFRAYFVPENTAIRDIGLYIGVEPQDGIRQDYIEVYWRPHQQIFRSQGFDGEGTGNRLNTVTAPGVPQIDAMFIARIAMDTFEIGWYDGDTRNVLVTRTMTSGAILDRIGFYADLTNAGYIGSFTSVIIEPLFADLEDMAAPIALDFGIGEDKDTPDDLLQIRPADMTLQEDSLRYQSIAASRSTSVALASVGNYNQGQDFLVETNVTLQSVPSGGLNRAGLVVLGGGEPFTVVANDDFYTLTFTPAEPESESAVLQIREGFHGEILVDAEWEGESFIGEVFADDFSDHAASASAWDNQVPWEVGLQDGRNVFATDLDGPAAGRVRDGALRSPIIDLTGFGQAVLSYSDFHQLDNNLEFHSARVSVLRASNPNDVLEVLSETTGNAAWRDRAFSLSEDSINAGQVIFEFYIKTDDWPPTQPLAGWSIADVAVSSSAGLPATFLLKAEGTFDTSGGLTLDFTVSDGNGLERTISTLIEQPSFGKFFGIGGRNQTGGPIFDFDNLIIELAEPPATTITAILDQTIFGGTVLGPLSFTVGDAEIDVASLTVEGSSSNTDLVPDENVVIEGDGAERTVTVTPAAGESGETVITLTVTNGSQPASTGFLLMVIAPNPPTITGIDDQRIAFSASTGPLAFTVGHQFIDPDSLMVSGSSSNTDLVPNENIVFDGSGADRSVTVTPVADMEGETTITLTVDDGEQTAGTSFLLTVRPDLPTITNIANQMVLVDTSTEALAFTVGHEDETYDLGQLTFSGSSSDTDLVPDENIVFGGSGADRTVTVTPASGWFGQTTITVTVNDGEQTASTSFLLTVEEATPPWSVPAELTDEHRLRYNFGTNFATPSAQYNADFERIIGSSGNVGNRNSRSLIKGFALPQIDSFDKIASATFEMILNISGPAWDVQAYIFSPEVTPPNVADANDIWWASTEEDPSDLVRTVDLHAITPATPHGPVSLTLSKEILEGFYDANGTPISAEGKIWFRINEGREPEGAQSYHLLNSQGQVSLTINMEALNENFDEGLDPYTATVILGADRSHVTEWETVDGALRLNTTSHEDGAQQHALTRTDVQLFVGYEWRASAIEDFTALQDIGLYVGAGHPVENVRENYVNVFMRNQGGATMIVGHGFAGTDNYNTVTEGVESFDSLFIARTGPITFDVGWYDGEDRHVLVTRTATNPNVGKAIGFYGDVRDVGIVGSLTSATVQLTPIALPAPGFDAWAGENIPEGFDRGFAASAVRDGVANGIKFAFGLDPMQRVNIADLVVIGRDEEGRLTITYRVDMDAEGVSVVPEVGLSLLHDGWFREDTGGDAPYVSISEGTLIEGSVYEFTATAMNIDDNPSAFMRVSVESN